METTQSIPDYADIQRLENLAWENRPTRYAHEYHTLAQQYTEDVVIDCISQYYTGPKW